jgi:hypothetical protein
MDDVSFDEPVVIDLGEPGRLRRVVMASQAADYLLHRWPASAGSKKHRAAREALMGALQGVKQARDARLAFADAANEARILVPPSKAPKRDALREIADVMQEPPERRNG